MKKLLILSLCVCGFTFILQSQILLDKGNMLFLSSEITHKNLDYRFLLNPEIPDSVKLYIVEHDRKATRSGFYYYKKKHPEMDDKFFFDITLEQWKFPNSLGRGNLIKDHYPQLELYKIKKHSNRIAFHDYPWKKKDTISLDFDTAYFPVEEEFLVIYNNDTINRALDLYTIVAGNAVVSRHDFIKIFKHTTLSNEIFIALRLGLNCLDTLPLKVYPLERYSRLLGFNFFTDTAEYNYFYLQNLVLPVTKGIPVNAFAKMRKEYWDFYTDFEVFFFTNYEKIIGKQENVFYEIRQKIPNEPRSFEEITPIIKLYDEKEYSGRKIYFSRYSNFPSGNIEWYMKDCEEEDE